MPMPDHMSNDNRGITNGQYSRLITVLIDNGIEPDESDIVAEAICFVLDVELDDDSTNACCKTREERDLWKTPSA